MAKNRKMQLRRRDVEWWMSRRQLPSSLRRRFRHFERQKWRVMGGEDEMNWIEELPEGLRRDIKRYLCLDLIKKVAEHPHNMSANINGRRYSKPGLSSFRYLCFTIWMILFSTTFVIGSKPLSSPKMKRLNIKQFFKLKLISFWH